MVLHSRLELGMFLRRSYFFIIIDKKRMTACQDYRAGHLIYKHNMGHESQPKEQVF